MAARTTILTRTDVTVEGSDLSASIMLDDAGSGHVMFSTAAGPSFSMDAARLGSLHTLVQECMGIRGVLLPEGHPDHAVSS